MFITFDIDSKTPASVIAYANRRLESSIPSKYFEDKDIPCPWDADIEIKNGQLILTGYAGPSGYGYCETRLPLNGSTKIPFEVYIPDPELGQREVEDFISILSYHHILYGASDYDY